MNLNLEPAPRSERPRQPRIILASGSARRPELLERLGVTFEVAPTNVDESSPETDPLALTRLLAERKARAGAALAPDAAVISADTVVVLDGRILGKPADAAEAREMLTALRNRVHDVVSGVAVVYNGRMESEVTATHVTMRNYTDAEMDAYIATGDPLDKSGSYAIQHPTFLPASLAEGCICSVVGLPLWITRGLLISVTGFDPGVPNFARCRRCPTRDPNAPA
jgi:septum formation protein